ncbi:hypothetical protein ABN196_18025, partial [Proteus terrae]|uniref:hypothetical protein n=1 Tax=Proteus terrae TaxID=1574161 RepID=UPI0032DA633F
NLIPINGIPRVSFSEKAFIFVIPPLLPPRLDLFLFTLSEKTKQDENFFARQISFFWRRKRVKFYVN